MISITMAFLMAGTGLFAQTKTNKDTAPAVKTQAVKKVYTCPMHAEVVSDKPGKCPKCGMTLVEKKQPAGGKPAGSGAKKDSSMKAMKM